MQFDQEDDQIEILKRHVASEIAVNDAVLETQRQQSQVEAERRLQESRRSLEDVLADYQVHIDTLARLHVGIQQVAVQLQHANSLLEPVPDDHVHAELLTREHQRRERQVNSLHARLRFGEILLGKISGPDPSNPEQAASTNGDHAAILNESLATSDGSSSMSVEERLIEVQDKIDTVSQKVLIPYLLQNVLPETKTLWENRTSLKENLTPPTGEAPDADATAWLDAREALWNDWQAALDDAGFSMEIPARGSEINYQVNSLTEVVDISPERAVDIDWSEETQHRVWDVAYPGLRWRPKDLLVLPAGVTMAHIVTPERQDPDVQGLPVGASDGVCEGELSANASLPQEEVSAGHPDPEDPLPVDLNGPVTSHSVHGGADHPAGTRPPEQAPDQVSDAAMATEAPTPELPSDSDVGSRGHIPSPTAEVADIDTDMRVSDGETDLTLEQEP